jgi:putative ABC transport system permease protein
MAVTDVMRSLLYQVSPTDPIAFAGVALAMLVVAVLAAILPAQRALRVDPAQALRAD